MGIPVEDAENGIVRVPVSLGLLEKFMGLPDDRQRVRSRIVRSNIDADCRDAKERAKVFEVIGFCLLAFAYDQATSGGFPNDTGSMAGEAGRFLNLSP